MKKTPAKKKRYRSAESGRLVTKQFADLNPKTTVSLAPKRSVKRK